MKMNVELLSPVGSFEALEKAIHNGADAVYLAGKAYGARAFADNFSNEELAQAIEYAHAYGVKAYITVNTLIYEDEIDGVINFLDYIYLNNADAVIVQDLGLSCIIKNRYPDLDLHASTQMNIHSLEQVRQIKELGFKRVVLGREVSLELIKEIKENLDIEIEVFIHGALCISYSGNCLMSSLIGKRSGNRGKCAQPCRMEYTLNGKTKYYLSTKDLCTADYLQDIIPYVDSLKIEGRMKNPSYIGTVTNNYRTLIDDLINKRKPNYLKIINELKISFNREFTKGFINNDNHKYITNVKSQNHLGTLIGEVVSYDNKGLVSIKLNTKLYRDDCLRFTENNGKLDTKDAIIVNEIYLGKKLVKEAGKGSVVQLKVHKKLNIRDKVYLTKSVLLDQMYNNKKKILITGNCFLDNNKLVLMVTDGVNKVTKSIIVEESDKDFSSRIKEQLLKTKDTIFEFDTLNINDLYCFTAIKNINQLRRDVLEKLYQLRIKDKDRIINNQSLVWKSDKHGNNKNALSIAVTTKEQLYEVLNFPIKDYDLYIRNKQLYEDILNNNIRININNVYYYPARVGSSYGKKNVVSNFENINNNDISPYFNVTNSYTVKALENLGAKRIGLSVELSKEKMSKMIKNYEVIYQYKPNVYVMIYGYYHAMIMKHCLLNKEFDCSKKECHLCDKGFKLVDRVGKEYPLIKDENCNSILLYHTPVNLFSELSKLKEIGVNSFLIDFSIESKEEVKNILSDFISGDFDLKGYKGHYFNDDL